MTETFTVDEVRTRLRQQCKEAGGQAKWARNHDISKEAVGMFLRGVRDVTPHLEHAMGLSRAWTLDRERNER